MKTPNEYREMPSIHSGHFDNLVHETSDTRVWVSRMTIGDGAPENEQVTIEHLIGGRWQITRESRGNEWVDV